MLRGFDNLRFGKAEIVSKKFRSIFAARMSQTLKVRLPVADVLIVDSVDHMLAKNVIRLISIGLIGKKVRGDEVCFVNRSALITTANRGKHLVAQPCQVGLEVAENQR